MKRNDLISIIVPVYNSAKTIRRAVESVINQTHKNLEIIIVWKKSSDGTEQILQEISDKRIRLVEQTEPTGPGGARNLGLDAARGEYLGFIEADDTLAPDFYEKLLAAIKSNNCDIAQGTIYYANGTVFSRGIQHNKVCDTPAERWASVSNGASFDKLFKTELIKAHNIRFAEGVRWEDNPFIFRAFYWGKLVMLADAVYFYNPGPWSETYREKLRADIIPVAKNIMEFITNLNLSKSEIKLVKRKMVTSFVSSFV
nr:glycosyltransferase [Alphaproteobacteria bacterium]